MARTFYDSLGLNEDIQLDLSMLEGTGELLHDESKNHSTATVHYARMAPLWQQRASFNYGIYLNRSYPLFDTDEFYDILAADCTNLNFTSGDYSLAMWFNWDFESYSQILMGKYIVDICGWEAYLHSSGIGDILTVRHHHGGTRTATYSLGWTQGVDHLWSYSRSGANAYHYRDGEPVTVYGSGALQDAASSVACDWRLGCRYDEAQNWLKAYFHRPRAASKLWTPTQHRLLYRWGKP